ncbi:MAG TPA: 3-phosphoshikimate 1-carboxyvinyltransferase [Acidimicrobiales bacterium]|nr:3-phosphoshikimate 1-carboxyvinyltransferase [Acidimicrobiales bacterium]
MTAIRVTGGGPLRGTVRTPGDKSISHRALLLGAVADGVSVVRGLSDGDDVAHTLAAVRQLGATVTVDGDTVTVTGGHLHPAALPVDCGNSGTGMRLLAGLVAGLDGSTTLFGDASLSSRPMDRIAVPLAAMGATVAGQGDRCRPPITVTGGHLRGIDWTPPVASAQVKSAVLLAGLSAAGETVVREAVPTRAHTEELLADAGADITVTADGAGGRVVRLRPSALKPLDLVVPGDPSQAAFWVVAGCVVPGSEVAVQTVYAGPERIGFVGVLQRMGGQVALVDRQGTTATVTARYGPLQGTVVDAAEIPSLDEVPVLAVAAAVADGVTVFRDVGELRVKESDRLAAVAGLVRAFGAGAEITGDDLVVQGVPRLAHGRSRSLGDHRMAMAAAVAGLAAGQAEVDDVDCVATSYPAFLDDLVALGGSYQEIDGPAGAGTVVAIDGPAGSGKSTVSRALADRLGLARLDTGAMYRSVAWAALHRGVDPADAAAVAALARAAAIDVGPDGVRIDGADATSAIRSPEVSRAVSVVAANPDVRAVLVARQRQWAADHGGGVVEGRDIGTVVFPDATVKVYLDASPEERARRRHDEPAEGVARRDRIDATRAASPLYMAEDARHLDTTGRTVEQVVEEILSWL